MNLSPVKFNILNNNNVQNGTRTVGALQNKHPKFHASDISFRGSAGDSFRRIVSSHKVTYTNAKSIVAGVDAIVGDNFLTTLLKKANVPIDKEGNLVFEDRKFLEDFISTVKYPFCEAWLDISIAAIKAFRKIPFAQAACDGLLNSKLLLKRQRIVEQQKSLSCAKALLEQFVSKQKGVEIERTKATETVEYNFGKAIEIFKDSAAAGIVNPSRNYVLRDERTLNRMGTATVSALYSAGDFYNITMLQKDDKKEAKKAGKARRNQELTRMALSASLTFLSLGVLNKYTKNNIIASSLVIALSSLIAEVGSRLASKTPLMPLSPEQAAHIAEQNEHNKDSVVNKNNTNSEKTTDLKHDTQNTLQKESSLSSSQTSGNIDHKLSQPAPEFKSSKSYVRNLYKDFSGENSLSGKVKENSQNKKISIKKVLGGCVAGFSLLFLAKKGLNGEFIRKAVDKKVYLENLPEIQKLKNGELSGIEKQKLLAKIKEEVKRKNGTRVPGDFVGMKYFKKISDFFEENITHRKVKVPLQKIYDKLDILALPENDKGIKTLLETYKSQAGQVASPDGYVTILLRRNVASGVFGGIKKMYSLAYTLFTAPIALLTKTIEKIQYEESTKTIDSLIRKKEGIKIIDKKKSISQLAQTIFNQDEVSELYGPFERIFAKRMSNEEIIDAIKKSTRNFDQGAETGEVAHLSRTIVTLLSSYFFVNDYRNKVLIESKGKAVDEAEREKNERIAHKLSNFVINGTLMNIFNSTFKRPLNESLLAATMVAAATETTNEFMVRKSICQPVGRMESRQELLDYEKQQLENDGLLGTWSRFFRKITGKKTLTQKAGISQDKK